MTNYHWIDFELEKFLYFFLQVELDNGDIYMAEINTQELVEELKLHIEVTKLSTNSTRLRGLMLMITNLQMTLTELSTRLGRSKSTVLHHLKKYEDLGAIKRIGKIYVYSSDFIKISNLQLKNIFDLKAENKKELEFLMFRKDIHTLSVIRDIFSQVISMYRYFETKSETGNPQDMEESLSFWKSHTVHFSMGALDEEEMHKYEGMRASFKAYLKQRRSLNKQNPASPTKPRTYMLIESTFPILEYTKFDVNNNKII